MPNSTARPWAPGSNSGEVEHVRGMSLSISPAKVQACRGGNGKGMAAGGVEQ